MTKVEVGIVVGVALIAVAFGITIWALVSHHSRSVSQLQDRCTNSGGQVLTTRDDVYCLYAPGLRIVDLS